MKTPMSLALVLFLASSVFAFSDIGLIKTPRTLAYYLMPNTAATSNLSSGLVYNEKKEDGSEVEVEYTSYRSFYLLTRNVTKLSGHKKYSLTRLGPLDLKAVIGLGLMYSPATGGGLIGDVGGLASVNLLEGLAAAVPLCFSFFSDGFMMNLSPSVYFKPEMLGGREIFAGFRIDARVIGSFGQAEQTGSGSMNTYYLFGIRSAI
jgi:hypothetical protein